MKKRIISMMILSAVTISTFAGCKKSETKPTTDEKGTPVEINVMVWDRGEQLNSGMTVTDNNLTKYIQENVMKDKNVKVNFVAVPRTGSDDKVVAMMAGGSAPDILLTYSRDVFGNFATQGGLTDLTAVMASDGQTITKNIPKETVTDVGILDGKQYAIMARRGIQVSRHVGYIRKDWLDTLGLPIPKTNEELIKTLYAFKEKDPGKLGAKNIPWGMGGTTGSEKYYLSFVNSYVAKPYEGENLWVYQENQAALNPQAKGGFTVLNKLYNDGIISKDFAVDTKDDKYKADISNGNVGFILEDSNRPFDWFKAAQKAVPNAQYVVTNAFTGVNNEYKNPAEPAYGTYIMVPKKSEAKAKAAMKYLDWMADINNASNVAFTPGYKSDANGIPVNLTNEEKLAKGYPGTTDDLNILNKHFAYTDDEAKIAASYNESIKYVNAEYMKNYAKSIRNAMVVYPVQQQILANSSKYGKAVQDSAIQFAYKTISAPANQFEAIYSSEYQKVVQAGFDKILKEKQDYYNQKVKK
jgi:putative aldouronate transport system substrate-binding protein